MKKATTWLLVALMAWWGLATTHAGKIFNFVCSATQTNPDTGEKTPCAFESEVTFGGGKLSKTLTGFCWSCSRFVYLHWTREGIDPKTMAAIGLEVVSKPSPIATLWDGATGKTLPLYPCPDCRKPIKEIVSEKHLKHCPKCRQSGFKPDPKQPMLIFD